jgi:hypothetical protein
VEHRLRFQQRKCAWKNPIHSTGPRDWAEELDKTTKSAHHAIEGQLNRFGVEIMLRIESLFFVFCGLALFYVAMKPSTEIFFMRILPSGLRVFVSSLLQALPVSLMLFGILGVFSKSGVRLIQHYPISFFVIVGIGTALFLWGNFTRTESVWPPDFPLKR